MSSPERISLPTDATDSNLDRSESITAADIVYFFADATPADKANPSSFLKRKLAADLSLNENSDSDALNLYYQQLLHSYEEFRKFIYYNLPKYSKSPDQSLYRGEFRFKHDAEKWQFALELRDDERITVAMSDYWLNPRTGEAQANLEKVSKRMQKYQRYDKWIKIAGAASLIMLVCLSAAALLSFYVFAAPVMVAVGIFAVGAAPLAVTSIADVFLRPFTSSKEKNEIYTTALQPLTEVNQAPANTVDDTTVENITRDPSLTAASGFGRVPPPAYYQGLQGNSMFASTSAENEQNLNNSLEAEAEKPAP